MILYSTKSPARPEIARESVPPSERVGVLLMAYGAPNSLDEIEPYLALHHGGRTPHAEEVAYLRDRYLRLWGGVPPFDVPSLIRSKLSKELFYRHGKRYQVAIGMRHWHPWIHEVIPQMAEHGIRNIIAIPLAPHASLLGTSGYRKELDAARENLDEPPDIRFVESWHLQAEYITGFVQLTRNVFDQFPSSARCYITTVFVAHNMPAGTRRRGDVYEQQLRESCSAVAERVGIADWHFAFRNAETRGAWLEPDIIDYLKTLYSDGVRNVLVVPISSIYDEVEVLYELDFNARQRASDLGMSLYRTAIPNTIPACINALASIVEANT